MELKNIEILLEKYFNGETNISEENELRDYFSSADVLPHLKQYQRMFGYFSVAAAQKMKEIKPKKSKTSQVWWLSIAASVAVLIGVVSYVNYNDKAINTGLGTYDNPEVALVETQKALAMLSNHVNTGIESVIYIKEYKKSKNLIFKEQ
ncbi:hypothetical protein [Flavobacterium degerlachei]|jgi:hypothetical protein|uniref:Uncharacterized protein n=1 Tax=Flavobacterium degerlachei TaxID=229203 RepID=A0A1H3C5D0_9FLAO|nr:hypothetical protein [Flavobacterium degerlachei]SDX49363.1 hypothetical protein SAMN05444338_1117 [Flavobacterium degerlachei]